MTSARPTVETDPGRSALMKRVRQRDTGPELAVRRILISLGARYRVNVSGLPGSPDVANRSRGKALFVHGCFWHFHQDCVRGRIPKRNRAFWKEKLIANRRRDENKKKALVNLGFDVLVLWECELVDAIGLRESLQEFWWR